MLFSRKLDDVIEKLKGAALCPSILNNSARAYSFTFLLNDIVAGLKIFLMTFPVNLAVAFLCGLSPEFGLLSSLIASFVAMIIGGSKYQVAVSSLTLGVVVLDIMSRYQYQGLLVVSLFVAVIMIVIGLLRFGSVLKNMSWAPLSAVSIWAGVMVLIIQVQTILGVGSTHSLNGFFESLAIFKNNMSDVTAQGFVTLVVFIAPIIILRLFFNKFISVALYVVFGTASAILMKAGVIPAFIDLKVVGQNIATSFGDSIFTTSISIHSNAFFIAVLMYALAISIILAMQTNFTVAVSKGITGESDLQENSEVISSGVSNFLSVAFGGVLVGPDRDSTVASIMSKTKGIMALGTVGLLSLLCFIFAKQVFSYIPTYCLSAILIVLAMSLMNISEASRFFNLKHTDSYLFWITVVLLLYVGFVQAVIISFILSLIFSLKKLISINYSGSALNKSSDIDLIDFMNAKKGYSSQMIIDKKVLNKIEFVQIDSLLDLSILQIIEHSFEDLKIRPSVVMMYFKNISFIDAESLETIRSFVQNLNYSGVSVVVSGESGISTATLQEEEDKSDAGHIYGYIVPDFGEALDMIVRRLSSAA